MRTPAFAIAWHLWTRHRAGIMTALAALYATLVCSPLLPIVPRMIATTVVLVGVMGYSMSILHFTDAVGNFRLGYPRRMYALPVPTRTLVGWPMLYGASVVVLLWVVMVYLVYRPSGFQTPMLVPALGLAAAMLWFQALAWSPFGRHELGQFIRIMIICSHLCIVVLWLWKTGQVDASMGALLKAVRPPVVGTLLAAYIVTAYALARAGVASDRRGDTWQWLPRAMRHAPVFGRPVAQRGPFRSPVAAQNWYEWDCHGLAIPGYSGVLLLLMCGMTLFDAARDTIGFRFQLTSFVLILQFMPWVLSFSIGSLRPFWMRERSQITFLATRPMRSEAVVAAKLRMTALSVLLMFAVMAVEIGFWIVASGYSAEAAELGRLFLFTLPGWRGVAVFALGAVTLPSFTWSLATASFPIVLTGRNAPLEVFNLAMAAGSIGLGAIVVAVIHHPAYLGTSLAILTGLAAGALVAKLILAGFAFRACLRSGLMSKRSMTLVIAAALGLAASAVALVVLLSEAGLLPVPPLVILCFVLLFVPLGRFGLAPLALEENRHR